MRPFSLYVHIPYCQAKCPYCDFNSYAVQQWPEQRYVDALCAELHAYARERHWESGALQTVFFGGGTPSLFAPHSIATILRTAYALWPPSSAIEVTLEANPGTIGLEKLRGFRCAGINRMSFGVQSFHAHHLRTLGRIHGTAEAIAAVRQAYEAGFDNVSLDLIFALPQQSIEEWEADLRQACALHPTHISAYNLTYEEGTLFHKLRAQGALHQSPDEVEVAMFTRAQAVLGRAGYRQYEISNYARPGRECRHNLNYWRSGAYLGVGAGAHSYAEPCADDHGRRWSNQKTPAAYIEAIERHGHARATVEVLDARQAHGEFMFLGLRCLDGLAEDAFRTRFGTEVGAVFPQVKDLREGDLLQCCAGRWKLTARGRLLADSVFATFL